MHDACRFEITSLVNCPVSLMGPDPSDARHRMPPEILHQNDSTLHSDHPTAAVSHPGPFFKEETHLNVDNLVSLMGPDTSDARHRMPREILHHVPRIYGCPDFRKSGYPESPEFRKFEFPKIRISGNPEFRPNFRTSGIPGNMM